MDLQLVRKFERDTAFREKIKKIALDYISLGKSALSYYSADFDYAYDMLLGYAAMTKEDLEKLERGHPRRFILPMVSTQITTMTTYIAQMLFGSDQPHKVAPRGPEDETSAEFINQLLRWNAEQQQMYHTGFLWVQDALTANRGIFYNCWQPLYGPKFVVEQVQHPDKPNETYERTRVMKEIIGGYCRAFLVSPYDFICDPAMPLWRFQEGRFAGHRTTVTMVELERRSKLPPEHPEYVMAWAVQELKEKRKEKTGAGAPPPATNPGSTGQDRLMSRSAYERDRVAGSPSPTGKADKNDGGVVDCFCLNVTLSPAENEIYSSAANQPAIFTILVADDRTVLNFDESRYAHLAYPYSAAEAKPNGMYQFSPSWASTLKPLQDYVDYLKNRHQDAISRTVGNVFICDPTKVDIDDFLDPTKEGKIIPLRTEAGGAKISDVIQQVAIKDLTENFEGEMLSFMKLSEAASGATSQIQGQAQGDSSATEFAGSQQMAAGRLSSIARLLSTQGLVEQTRQFVSMFQQFLTLPQAIRFVPTEDTPEQLLAAASFVLNRDLIQGQFDYIDNDGTLPGTDGKKVAAITRILETAGMFQQVFMPAPGNLDPRKLIFAAAKASDVNIQNFKYRPQDMGSAAPPPPDAGMGGPPPGGGQQPGPAPAQPAPPGIPPIDLGGGATPPQTRPNNTL
jgi:hypothetical protein